MNENYLTLENYVAKEDIWYNGEIVLSYFLRDRPLAMGRKHSFFSPSTKQKSIM
jgi:hypothetical protein